MTDKELVFAFLNAINDHDVDKIYDFMTDNHIFIDGSGGQNIGKIGMKEG
jgi:ketosteroid isomerase-like protein